MVSNNLEKKRALVTGGGSGINFELTKVLRAQGCAVLVADIALKPEAADWLKSIDKDAGPQVLFCKTDVTVLEQLAGAFDFFAKEYGGVPEIVVPGAGVYEASFPGFWDEREDSASLNYKLLDINLMHPIRMTRMSIQRMRKAKQPGTILHLSSITAQKPSVVLPLYSASKAAISQFVRCMAPLDDICGIRVVGVAPGLVNTPLFRDHPEAQDHVDLTKDFLLPAEEAVKAMMALLTDRSYSAGTILEVADIGNWREVQISNDPGPQGRSTRNKVKTFEAISRLRAMLLGVDKGLEESSRL